MNLHRFSMTALTGALLCSASVHAQTTAQMGPAALQGTVSSAEEGKMEGVLVSAKKMGSTITTTVVTDENGHYAFPASRLSPGHYTITVRAVSYKLNAPMAADIAAKKALTEDIALKKVVDIHELALQLTNAEWMNSMPGPGVGCTDCHTVQRIVTSTHTSEEWVDIIQRMATYSNGSTPETPQPLVPGPRQENGPPPNPAALEAHRRLSRQHKLKQRPGLELSAANHAAPQGAARPM